MNWHALMTLGLGHLRLSPAVFWSMTPAELRAVLGPRAADPMTRQALDGLLAQHPDSADG